MTEILGIGIDIVEVERIRDSIEKQGTPLLERLFTPSEREYCSSMKYPEQHYAVRFAAKEALFKALGTGWSGGIGWNEVEIVRDDRGRPSLILSGKTEEKANEMRARSFHLSLSHTDDYGVAQVVVSA